MKAECPFDSAVFCSLTQSWTRLESKTTTIEPKSRQEGMLNSPVLSLWLPWSYFSRLLRSCIGTVGLFSLPRPHRVDHNTAKNCTAQHSATEHRKTQHSTTQNTA